MMPNFSPKEHATRIVGKAVAAKKIIAVLISLLLVALLLLIIVLVNAVQKTTSTKPEEVNVSLKKEYENPFSTEAQYINPFSKYKNPFDNLVQ